MITFFINELEISFTLLVTNSGGKTQGDESTEFGGREEEGNNKWFDHWQLSANVYYY